MARKPEDKLELVLGVVENSDLIELRYYKRGGHVYVFIFYDSPIGKINAGREAIAFCCDDELDFNRSDCRVISELINEPLRWRRLMRDWTASDPFYWTLRIKKHHDPAMVKGLVLEQPGGPPKKPPRKRRKK